MPKPSPYKRDPVRALAWHRAWRARNPDYYKTYNKAHGRKRREERTALIRAFKNRPCVDCGGEFPPVCMDFDHKLWGKGTRKSMSERASRMPLDKLQAELQTCDVVCANCHRIRTEKQRDARKPSIGRVN